MNIGAVIQSFETSTSTNDLAKMFAEKGAEEGTVIIAEEQTRGRGTKGRTWESPRRKGLYASIILRPKQKDISLLPLMAGVACVDAIRAATGLEVNLKWPNDIVWRRKKLGGILAESGFLGEEVIYVILGLGLNVSQRRSDFPEGLRWRATSLRLALKAEVDRSELERILWSALDRWYELFRQGEGERIIRAYEAYFIIPIGKIVIVEKEGAAVSGVLLGIDPHGRLRLEKNGREMSFSPAEILGLSDRGRKR